MDVKRAFEMELELFNAIDPNYFETGVGTEEDKAIYAAYSAVQDLGRFLRRIE